MKKTLKIIAFTLLVPALVGMIWVVRYAVRDYCFRYTYWYYQGAISFEGKYDIWDNMCLEMITIFGPRKGIPDSNINILFPNYHIPVRDLSPEDLISLGAEKIILGDRVSYSYYSDNISHPYSFTGMFKDNSLVSFQFAIIESADGYFNIPITFATDDGIKIELPISAKKLESILGPPGSISRQWVIPMP